MQDENSFLPWYNFPLIAYLEEYLTPQMNIFEYGCGFSTLFYAQKQCNVITIETNSQWQQKITNLAKKHSLHVQVKLCKPHEMPQQIHEYQQLFDVIVIDSLHRIACLTEAKKVYRNGIIILDNSERENLQKAENIMQGFSVNIFEGEGINREGKSQAKVFYR